MARKIQLVENPKPFDNVNIKTKGILLQEGSLFWGNKTLAATKAFESYIYIRRIMAKKFSSLFTIEEVYLLIKIYPNSSLISYASIKKGVVDELKEHSLYEFPSLLSKVDGLSDVELIYLMLEIERIISVRTYGPNSNYLSFIEEIKL